jgi:hypothetical protein
VAVVASIGDLVGRLLGRADEDPERLVLPPVPTAADLVAELDRVEEMVADAAVPGPVESRVRRVATVVRDAVPRLDRLGSGSEQAYLVMATATDYLPDAVDAYLRLPRDWANTRPVDRGRTSLMVLVDQLDLLARTMDQVLDAVNRRDAAALVAHGRFLAARFGTAGGRLSLDAAGGPVSSSTSSEPPVGARASQDGGLAPPGGSLSPPDEAES